MTLLFQKLLFVLTKDIGEFEPMPTQSWRSVFFWFSGDFSCKASKGPGATWMRSAKRLAVYSNRSASIGSMNAAFLAG